MRMLKGKWSLPRESDSVLASQRIASFLVAKERSIIELENSGGTMWVLDLSFKTTMFAASKFLQMYSPIRSYLALFLRPDGVH